MVSYFVLYLLTSGFGYMPLTTHQCWGYNINYHIINTSFSTFIPSPDLWPFDWYRCSGP